ncbi:hypothetical protein PHM2_012 [Prochlorococcus phage P-HM2]|uniref:Uncharacterized protein n=1 Tax=Prochlorococcus phage P-HM2 TaxID=445696 RepID=E3SSL2_9CAUD|nr:hypothetical protein PHM2_012 [Prochlorococcus phage P-HM2]ADO99790.1 hypothetical protein PHM2_012 [Prochlorococcus phage P-HM2]
MPFLLLVHSNPTSPLFCHEYTQYVNTRNTHVI